MDRPLLKQYLDTMGEVKGLCTSVMIRGAYKFELDNIKRLQMKVQSINVDDLVNEIFVTTPDDKDGIKKALSVYDYRLKNKLFKVDIDEDNITDVGDNNGEVLKHFVDEAARLQATAPDNLKSFYMCEEDANEFVVRLRDILEWCNSINETFVAEYKKLSSWLVSEPQPENSTPKPDEPDLPKEQTKIEKATRGRQRKLFTDYVVGDKQKHLEALKKAMNGKKGKEAALIIRVAINRGLITKPTFQAVTDCFGDIGSRSGYNKYMNDIYKYTSDELTGAKAQLCL